MRSRFALSLVAALLIAGPAQALSVTYLMNMTGAQEVPGPGDPDGLATGTITLDDATGLISWDFVYQDIAAPSMMHIHTGGAGASGSVLVNLGIGTSGGAGTLISSMSTSTTTVSMILSDPDGFYVNIHNGDFGAGAVRGQLGTPVPEPASALLLACGLLALSTRRRA